MGFDCTNLLVDVQVTTLPKVSNCFVIAKEVLEVYSSFLCLTSGIHETEHVKSDEAVFQLYWSKALVTVPSVLYIICLQFVRIQDKTQNIG